MSNLSSSDILLTKSAEQLLLDLRSSANKPSEFPDSSLSVVKRAHMSCVQSIVEIEQKLVDLNSKREEIKAVTPRYHADEDFMKIDKEYNELMGSLIIYITAAERYNRCLLAFIESRRCDINDLVFSGNRTLSEETLSKLHNKENTYLNNVVSIIGDYLDKLDLSDDILTRGHVVPLPETISCEIEYLEDDQRIYESDMSTATIKRGSIVRTHLNEIEEELCTGKAKMKLK